jgi:hypothetical protein
MEEVLKKAVQQALEARLGKPIEITHGEWEDAKREVLNDVYVHKLAFFLDVPAEYFINTMVNMLVITKRIAA